MKKISITLTAMLFLIFTTNADLFALTVSSGTLSPDFDAATTAYTVSVANSLETITATGTRLGFG